jgi:hypothetical protein
MLEGYQGINFRARGCKSMTPLEKNCIRIRTYLCEFEAEFKCFSPLISSPVGAGDPLKAENLVKLPLSFMMIRKSAFLGDTDIGPKLLQNSVVTKVYFFSRETRNLLKKST